MDIIDIRPRRTEDPLLEDLKNDLESNPPKLPSMLLWDEPGLKYFEGVTKAPEYYLTPTEKELIRSHAQEIARQFPSNVILVELGSGALHKIKILLEALDELVSRVDYYALDLDKKELDRTLKLVKPGTFKHVSCHGLLGTYDDFKDWLKSLDKSRPICLLSLGSTIGSFERDDAARFLKGFAEALRARSRRCDSRPSDLLLVGIDGCKDEHQVWSAYNDSTDANEKFIRNALTHANAVLGENAFRAEEWERQGRWNSLEGRHEQYLIPNVDVRVNGACLPAGKDILLVCSHKYDAQDRETLFKKSGLESVQSWKSDKTDYGLYLLAPISR